MSETVYAVYNYHDGPLSGVADFEGRPHIFENAYFDEAADRWSDVFLLRPIDAQVFAWTLEKRQVLLRWRRAVDQGEATYNDYPDLPSDRLRDADLNDLLIRNRELNDLLREYCHVDETNAVHQARGKFERADPDGIGGTTKEYRVHWTPLP